MSSQHTPMSFPCSSRRTSPRCHQSDYRFAHRTLWYLPHSPILQTGVKRTPLDSLSRSQHYCTIFIYRITKHKDLPPTCRGSHGWLHKVSIRRGTPSGHEPRLIHLRNAVQGLLTPMWLSIIRLAYSIVPIRSTSGNHFSKLGFFK